MAHRAALPAPASGGAVQGERESAAESSARVRSGASHGAHRGQTARFLARRALIDGLTEPEPGLPSPCLELLDTLLVERAGGRSQVADAAERLRVLCDDAR